MTLNTVDLHRVLYQNIEGAPRDSDNPAAAFQFLGRLVQAPGQLVEGLTHILSKAHNAALKISELSIQRVNKVRDSLEANKLRITLVVMITLVAMACMYSVYKDFNQAEDDELLAPECRTHYQYPSIWPVQDLKEKFVLSYIKKGPISITIASILKFFGQWVENEKLNFVRNQTAYEKVIEKTLSRKFVVEHNEFESTNFSQILKNRLGVSVAVLKSPPSWKEEFIREFNTDNFLGFPSITRVKLPDRSDFFKLFSSQAALDASKTEYQAIEFLPGAQGLYSGFSIDDHSLAIYPYLSVNNMISAIDQRQRILILDLLLANSDRHDGNIMLGCHEGQVVVHPIDHDCTMNVYNVASDRHPDNLLFRSELTERNRNYIASLSFEMLDAIFDRYTNEINRDASTASQRYNTELTIPRTDAMKIQTVLLKICVENFLNVLQIHHFMRRALDWMVDHYTEFGFEMDLSAHIIEANIRRLLERDNLMERALNR